MSTGPRIQLQPKGGDSRDRLGHKPEYKHPKDYHYKSPIRNERNSSFAVSLTKNLWYDAAETEGGDIIAFVRQYFSCDVSQALKHIEQIMGTVPFLLASKPPQQEPQAKQKKGIVVHRVKVLKSEGYGAYLVTYLKSRNIPLDIAQCYLNNVSFYLNGKHYFGLGWKNTKDGWELRNQHFKTATNKAYSLIQGTSNKSAVNVFEGMIDFLSALVYYGKDLPPNDTIILNSTSLVNSALGHIQCYDMANLYLDNDKAGNKATRHIQANHLKAIDRRDVFIRGACPYTWFKDFNDYLVKTR